MENTHERDVMCSIVKSLLNFISDKKKIYIYIRETYTVHTHKHVRAYMYVQRYNFCI